MNIRESRKKAGITQGELARQIHVTQQAVAQWESGETTPRAAILPKLAAALQCSVGDLFQQPEQKEA